MILINPFVYGGGGGGGGSITTANLVLSLDAGSTVSYSGSGQVWNNTVTSPADSAAQTDYNFDLGSGTGSSASDPTFTGTAGDGAAYWAFAGSEYFGLSLGATSTTFLKGLHKTGAKFTLEAWVYHPGTTGGNINPVFSSGASDQGGADVSRGVIFADFGTLNTANGKHNCVRVKRDSSGANALAKEGDTALSTGWHMLACSVDGTGAANSFLYTDGALDPVGGVSTWDGTFSSPGSSDPTNAPKIGDRGDGVFKLPNGSRLAIFRAYNTNLSQSQLDANWNAVRARYGL